MEHLYYEIWMLFEVTALLEKMIPITSLQNALLESFGIHAAILVEFFYDKGSHPDTARASDFFENTSDWQKLIPSYQPYFDPIRGRRNKELAHLSYDRLKVSLGDKPWNFGEISRQLSINSWNILIENLLAQSCLV